ncbi:adenosine deaminase-like protein [Saccostrea cucullata]|uniref:adenosine deaminase-like protein n=1 Tax=Saccostrea cuccullata TaxID=36930 RepID=UPI002ED2EC37
MEEFCKSLPKVELHAHINGSVSEATIQKLLAKKKNSDQQFSFKKGSTGTLKECFEKFRLIHQLTDNTESVYQVTCDVIHEFHDDNVKYLELRSTPRAVQDTGMSRESYVESVLRAIQDCGDLDIIVRFLLAIDRRNGVKVGWETLRLAQKFQKSHGDLVVGMDLSGDPSVGDARDYLPVFREAQKSGLKLALHLCEIPAPEETMEMLTLPPDRIGHGTFLHTEAGGNQQFENTVLKNRTPLELCLTSNLIGQTVPNLDNHQFKFWYEKEHPCVICTDDKGVFSTSMSEEYQLAASTFDLKQRDLWNLSEQSINYTFCEENVKEKLRDQFKVYKSKMEEQFNIKL